MSVTRTIDAATGTDVTVTQLTGPAGQPMVELTAIYEYDFPVRLSLEETDRVIEALQLARERRLSDGK